jgi:hypothetical protein
MRQNDKSTPAEPVLALAGAPPRRLRLRDLAGEAEPPR